jgi:two-component system CheB/CheR fusion protein
LGESEEGKGSAFHFTVLCDDSISDDECTESSETSAKPARPLGILLVEDNHINQRLAARLLEKRGHAVTVVENGIEAVRAVRVGKFDLAFMDVQMPEMDVREATREIRRLKNTVPIIALTAHAMEGDRERCLDAGMDGYLSKPILIEDFQRLLHSFSDRLV